MSPAPGVRKVRFTLVNHCYCKHSNVSCTTFTKKIHWSICNKPRSSSCPPQNW
uniref:Uncharacterized protein n=1 Tax=Anguilla anguilla TaxID=7936 RepID=A0A0E9U2U5_ANGAN